MKAIRRTQLAAGNKAALERAVSVLSRAYCPHSGLSVAACLVTGPEAGACGVNYECDSYGLTLCAERAALSRAQADGSIGATTALVLVAKALPHVKVSFPLLPCGACRQWISELSQRLGLDLTVISFGHEAETGIITSARDLLPAGFSMNKP